eukprot:TRINITY_DN305_c0_g2_i1.p1 TRINITY_DN305_c0_g2~~TRINITY_DN305_c0_g2_i1.p1  ORF type:complete len:183 (+),score=0.18 TRINITY_DN305_c0_g2_i1:336-884(+)
MTNLLCFALVIFLPCCFSQAFDWPVKYVNSAVTIDVNYNGTKISSTGAIRFDSRTTPVRQHSTTTVNDITVDQWVFFYADRLETTFDNNGTYCTNTTVLASDPSWPVCTAWAAGPGNTKTSTCTSQAVTTGLSVTLDGAGNLVSVDVVQKGPYQLESTIKVLNPTAPPPTDADFVLPTICLL